MYSYLLLHLYLLVNLYDYIRDGIGGNSKSLKVGVHRLQKPPPPANMGSRDNVHGKGQGVKPWHFILFQIATQKLQWQVCHAKKKKKEKKKKRQGRPDYCFTQRVASFAYEISCLVLFSNHKQ